MSKYIYCNRKIYDRRNYAKLKIYLGEEIDGIDLKNKYRLVELPYEHENTKTVLEHMNSYIEFDNFEDLIEVGDLVVVEDGYTNIKIKTNFQIVTNIKNRIIETRDYFRVNKIVFEIWKRVNNTFIRVAHKIDNE